MNFNLQPVCKIFNYLCSVRKYSTKIVADVKINMKILSVAEKNDAAKHIAGFLSDGNVQRKEGLSQYNKIYEFNYNFRGRNVKISMTSVSGHLLSYEFVGFYKKWKSCSPDDLFEAPVVKQCPQDFLKIKATLEREAKSSDILIIWTDCDREGENIGFEIISVCRKANANIQVYRAKFSEITKQSVKNAMNNLGQPNKQISDAVDVRSELDLRIGASFTRFQTLRLQKVFPDVLSDSLISYGSCQFPTLGFVVERYKAVQDFIPEPFWKIKVTHKINDLIVDFLWKRTRLFDQLFCQVLYEKCIEQPRANIIKVQTKPKSKWRPIPLDTIELEKVAGRKLKMNAKETMHIAERLYNQGFISYPRTETNIFPHNINLYNLVELHTGDNRWGQFAVRVLQEGVNPRQGKKSDQAHPPIHPIKYTDGLNGNERKVYEYIVRHFLACLSKDAEGLETVVEIDINNERFEARGLQILEKNYLEVYHYENWNVKEIHSYRQNDTFNPTSIELVDGETSAPNLLTEPELISLMEKNGIGTDATHAEHIDTIKQRMYVGLLDEIYFVPGELGLGLVEGYDSMGFEMSKPHLRAELENDLKKICENTKNPKIVLAEQINKYRDVFRKAVNQANKLDLCLSKYLKSRANIVENNLNSIVNALPENILKCSSCGSNMVLKHRQNNPSFISCQAYPQCRNAIWFPDKVIDIQLSPDTCVSCGNNVRLLKFKFRPGSMAPYYFDVHTGCVGGCDSQLLESLEINGAHSNFPHSDNNINSSGDTVRNSFINQNAMNRLNDQQGTTNRNFNPLSFDRKFNLANNSRNFRLDSAGDADIQCNCGVTARKYTVQKENANKGRQFFACSKPLGEPTKCTFFLWADNNAPQNNIFQDTNYDRQHSNYNRNFHNSNQNRDHSIPNFRAKKRAASTTINTRTQRKCGNCRQEGHTRNNCPLLID